MTTAAVVLAVLTAYALVAHRIGKALAAMRFREYVERYPSLYRGREFERRLAAARRFYLFGLLWPISGALLLSHAGVRAAVPAVREAEAKAQAAAAERRLAELEADIARTLRGAL